MSQEQLNLMMKTAFVLGAGYLAYRVVTAPKTSTVRQLPPPLPAGSKPKLVRKAPTKRLSAAV